VDFVIHVFLSEKRAFYDIERLRKSARPLSPAEFDAELTTALKEKTRAVRGKKTAKALAKKPAAKKKTQLAKVRKAPAPKPRARKAVPKARVRKKH
jgi:ribosome-associated protein